MSNQKKFEGKIIVPARRKPWPHEICVANILASAGHDVEFLPENNLKTADILLDGVEYEIKSPISNKPDKLERNIKRALKQSRNIIFDSARIKRMHDNTVGKFLVDKAKNQHQIGSLIFITKNGKIIDIKNLTEKNNLIK